MAWKQHNFSLFLLLLFLNFFPFPTMKAALNLLSWSALSVAASLVSERMDGPRAGSRGKAWLAGSCHCWSMWDGHMCSSGSTSMGVSVDAAAAEWAGRGSQQPCGVTAVQHVVGHLPERLKHRCPWHVPPTSRNSREEQKEEFLLIAVEGRLLVCGDFWEHRIQAQIRGSNYAEKNTQL